MGRKIRLVTALLVVIGLAWTGIWLFIRSEVASRMDAELDKLRSRGLVIDCPDRSITGWPFRIEVACVGPSLSMPDRLVQAHAKALRVMALIYQPTTLIGELDGPVTASGANGEDIAADWRLLQASVKLAGTRPSLVSIAGDGLSGTLRKPGTPDVTFVAEHGEVHGRPAPDAAEGQVDIDLAARFAAVTLTLGGKPLGPAEGNLLIDSVARRLPARAEPGASFDSTSASITTGTTSATISTKGTLTPKSPRYFVATKKTSKEDTYNIPKKTNPSRSEGYSRKKLFEFTIYS